MVSRLMIGLALLGGAGATGYGFYRWRQKHAATKSTAGASSIAPSQLQEQQAVYAAVKTQARKDPLAGVLNMARATPVQFLASASGAASKNAGMMANNIGNKSAAAATKAQQTVAVAAVHAQSAAQTAANTGAQAATSMASHVNTMFGGGLH